MTRPEFLECLLRVALRRFLAPGRAQVRSVVPTRAVPGCKHTYAPFATGRFAARQESSAARALRRFLSHHFLRFAPRIIPRALRVTALHSEEVSGR